MTDVEELAARYLRYARWFVREGSARFRAYKERARARIAAAGSSPEELRAAMLAEPVERHEDEDAVDEVDELIRAHPELGWPLVAALVRQCPDDDTATLGFLGAGPFESWVSEEELARVRDEFTAALRDSDKLRYVASCSWNRPPTLAALLAQYPPRDP
jgi:hypothetical protein